ncbi:hypothetical protein B0H14DRAFT_2565558 [Mycena olivaceomarginata]|nr:hypothetical protein B0H14DRAFT_2565558 [Mycena olivaceomarginata]
MEGDPGRVAGPLAERKRRGGRESGGWKRNDTRSRGGRGRLAPQQRTRTHKRVREARNTKQSGSELVARRGDANAPQQAFYPKDRSLRLCDRDSHHHRGRRRIWGPHLALGGRGLGVGFAGGLGASAPLAAPSRPGWARERQIAAIAVAGVGSRQRRSRRREMRRAVPYADGGEDDTTKSYDVGEAVVCWDWRKRGSLDDVGSVGLEGDVGEGAFRACRRGGDVGDCGLGGAVASGNGVRLCGAGGHGSCIRPTNLMPAGSGPRTPAGPRRRWRPGSPRARRRRRGGCRCPRKEPEGFVREHLILHISGGGREGREHTYNSKSSGVYQQAYAPWFP